MNEIARIVDQMNRAFDGEAWHGPSLMNLLRKVNSETAISRPSSRIHSIWELTIHIAVWERSAVRYLRGEIFEVSDEEDWPAITDTSESAWLAVLNSLETGHAELISAVGEFDESKLDDPVPGKDFSYYVLLHGVVQHNIYHAGQIAYLTMNQ